MDTIALSTFTEPVAMPIQSSESSPMRDSLFGALVAAVVKDEGPEAQSSTDTAVDAAAPQVDSIADMSPRVIVGQWLAQADSPALLPKVLISGLEKFQTNEQDPVTPEAALPQSSELDDAAPNEAADVPTPQSDSATPLVANEKLISSDKQLLRATAVANVSSRSPDALQPDRAALSEAPRLVALPATFEESRRSIQDPAGIGWSAPETKSGRASGNVTGPVTPRGLSESAVPDRLTSAPPSRGSMTDETMAHAPDEPKTAQRGTPAASQRPQEPLPQFAASAQPNTPASTPDGISVPLQVGNVSATVDGSAEVPVKVALATRDTQAAQMQTLALHIAARSARGDSRFTIRLDPPELGRIEVNLSVTSHGHAQAVVAVEKPQTLDLLLRDAPALERALKDAGLELGSNLSFSLKEEGRPHLARDERYPPADRTLELVSAEAANVLSVLNTPLLEQLYGLRTARLDITV